MRVAILCSGGKDSVFALHRALQADHHVVGIVSMLPKDPSSWMFHWPNTGLTGLFSEALGIPVIQVQTSGQPELELEDLKSALSALSIEGVVSGAVASNYQKTRIDRICQELDLDSIAPLWKEDPTKLLREEVSSGFHILITAVAAEGLGPEWLGRILVPAAVEELLQLCNRFGINPVGEGGEYETLVLDGPIFRKRITVREAESRWEGNRGCYFIKRAELEEKT